MKYELDMEKDNYGDPVDVLLADKGLLAIVFLYLSVIGISLYYV